MASEPRDVDSIVKSLTDKTAIEINESRKKYFELFFKHLEKDYKRNKDKAETIKSIKRGVEFSTSIIGIAGVVSSTVLLTVFPVLPPLFGSILAVGSALQAFIGLAASKLGLSTAHVKFTKKAELYKMYMDKVDLFYRKSMKDGILSDKEYDEYLSIDEEFKIVLNRFKKVNVIELPLSNAFTDVEVAEYIKEGKELAKKELKDIIIEKTKNEYVSAVNSKKKF